MFGDERDLTTLYRLPMTGVQAITIALQTTAFRSPDNLNRLHGFAGGGGNIYGLERGGSLWTLRAKPVSNHEKLLCARVIVQYHR